MRYFRLNTAGDLTNRRLAFVSKEPDAVGLWGFCLAQGERIGEHYPDGASTRLQPEYEGTVLSDLLGNSVGYCIVTTRMRNAMLVEATFETVEVRSLVIVNHRNRQCPLEYWVVNPLTFIDCLDRGASGVTIDEETGDVSGVDKFVLRESALEAKPQLFRIPEAPSEYFVGERLIGRLIEAKLSNVFLREVELSS